MSLKNVKTVLKKNVMLIVLVLVYLFFFCMTRGDIFKPMKFTQLVTENAYVFILACGMLMCMLTGGNIDLSCGSVVCLLGAIGGVLMVINKMNSALSVVIMLLVAIAYGCGLGYLVAYVNIPPWIATLAGYLAFRGLGTSILSSNSSTGSIAPFPDDFMKVFSGKVFQTKMSVFNVPCMTVGVVAAAIVVVAIFWSRATRLQIGRAHV